MKLTYDGPKGGVSRELGAETGRGDFVEPGFEYEVSDGLGVGLMLGCSFWRTDADGQKLVAAELERRAGGDADGPAPLPRTHDEVDAMAARLAVELPADAKTIAEKVAAITLELAGRGGDGA